MPLHDTPAGPVETREWGDGPELVVLLHAAASSPQALAGLAERLARPERRVIAPMLNGYGRTAIAGAGDSLEAHVAVAAACSGFYPATRRIVFGHSMGGLIALLRAMRDGPPDALILYEPIVVGALNRVDPEDAAALEWDGTLVRELGEKLAEGDGESGVAAFVEGWNETRWAAIPEAARARLAAAASTLAAETRAVHDCSIDATAWDRVTAPVLLLQGTISPPLVSRIMTGLLRRLPRVRRTVLAELGHMGPALRPAPVAAALEDFLRRSSTPPHAQEDAD